MGIMEPARSGGCVVSRDKPVLEFAAAAKVIGGALPVRQDFRDKELHVWGCQLEGDAETVAAARRWLDDGERQRADRLIRPEEQRRFILAHACQRAILGRYAGCDPAEIVLQPGFHGKPEFLNDGGIRFNLSHSHGHLLVAVARDRAVGVDLEPVRDRSSDMKKLAERFFAPDEYAAIAAAAPSRRAETFARYWVAKEAFLKYQGIGLQFPLGDCQVLMAADVDRATIAWRRDRDDAESGLVRFLRLPPGWVGAVSAQGTDWTVRFGEWPAS